MSIEYASTPVGNVRASNAICGAAIATGSVVGSVNVGSVLKVYVDEESGAVRGMVASAELLSPGYIAMDSMSLSVEL